MPDNEKIPRKSKDGYDPDISQAEIDWMLSLADEDGNGTNGSGNQGTTSPPGVDGNSGNGRSDNTGKSKVVK